MSLFWLILQRESKLAYRQRYEVINPLLFFFIMITLFILASTPDPQMLLSISPAIIWVGILLMTLLSYDRIFKQDYHNGVLEQWLLAPQSFHLIVVYKMIAHWFIIYLPLILVMPLLMITLHLSWHVLMVLICTLLLGTPSISLIGSIFAGLTLQLRQGGLLLALLILPFYIPILIFSASAVANAMVGLPVSGQFAFLGAILALVLPLAPLATVAALRIGMN